MCSEPSIQTPSLCDLCAHKTYDPRCVVFVNGKQANAIRDTGAVFTVVSQRFVNPGDYTGETMSVVLASGVESVLPVARVQLVSPFVKGELEVLVMAKPAEEVLIGNQVRGSFSQKNIPVYANQISVNAVQTRRQKMNENQEPRRLEKDVGVRLDVSTTEIIEMQEKDKTLRRAKELCSSGAKIVTRYGETSYIRRGRVPKVPMVKMPLKSEPFLGHKIGKGKIQPLEDKLEKIHNAPQPSTKKQVRSFLGLIGFYRKFFPSFATVAQPLTDLLKGNMPTKVEWNQGCESSFLRLKEQFCSPPVCHLPLPDREFILETDASETGLGAVLAQRHDDGIHPVACVSRKLKGAELNYPIVEKECLAIVWAIDRFQSYLFGKPFTVRTDHSPLQYLSRMKSASGRLTRWALQIQPYQFVVEAIPGSENRFADYLSRLPSSAPVSSCNMVEINGDVFDCDSEDAMAHCVSSDFVMGAGIAQRFKDTFKQVDTLIEQGKKVGEVAVLPKNGSFIYYLVSKELYHQKPTYNDLELCLGAMKTHSMRNGVKTIAIPRIGCGLDGLEWNKVKDILVSIFKDTGVMLKVYVK